MPSILSKSIHAEYAPPYAIGLGVVRHVYRDTREVDLVDLGTGDDIHKALLVGPELPPVYGEQEDVTGRKPEHPVCMYAFLYAQHRKPIALYLPSQDVDQDERGQGYRYHFRLGGFRVLISGDGATAKIEQRYKDGDQAKPGPTVTLDGQHVIVGDSGSAKCVARKGDAVVSPLSGVVLSGQIAAPGVAGSATLTLDPVHADLDGSITQGSASLKVEDNSDGC